MEHMDAIIRAREIIKRKYNALRRGEEETSKALEKTFKPIAEPLKAMLRRKPLSDVPEAMMDVKKEEKFEPPSPKKLKAEDDESQSDDDFYENFDNEENEEYEEFNDAEDGESEEENPANHSHERMDLSEDQDHQLDNYIGSSFGPMSSSYFREMITDGEQFDNMNGIRVGNNGEWMLGDTVARFDKEDNLLIGDQIIPPTRGLLELIFKRDPQEYTTDDLHQYKRILDLTNAHKRMWAADQPIRGTRADKYKNIIKPLYNPIPLPSKQTGSGLFVPLEKRRTYVYWDDPNELVQRLALLISSREAGNTGLEREILSIEEELREGGYIQ